jgi:phosphatidylserine/phosphatidylglycerophosphate/cardiolipin synthase-like enzyme
MPYYCNICKEPITAKECSYSISHYNRPLCRKHQDIAKKAAAVRLADSEQKTYTGRQEPKADSGIVAKAPEVLVQSPPAKSESPLIQWLTRWVADRPVNLSVESKHFFLEGMRLEELARDVIDKAQNEILVTSPFVDSCHPATALQEAVGRSVKVKVVARRPSTSKIDAAKRECQANLRKKGVHIHYVNPLHSKIIVIDREIAIVSSMNLYSGSTGGALLEAGIVSFDKKVVDSATKYIVDLLEKPESADTDASGSRYERNYRRY